MKNMTMEDLIAAVQERIGAYLPPEWSPVDAVIFPSISRPRGTDCRIRPACFPAAGSVIYPVIHLDDIIAKNVDEEEALSAIAAVCTTHTQEAPGGFWRIFEDFSEAKDHIRRRVYSHDVRPELARNYVHEDISHTDLFVIYTIDVSGLLRGRTGIAKAEGETTETDRNGYTINISAPIMRKWGVTIDDLRTAAEANEAREGLVAMQIGEVIREVVGDALEPLQEETAQIPMLVLSNKEKSFGASAFLHKSIGEKVARAYGRTVYLLPSSVHEVMVVPTTIGTYPGTLSDMVKEINTECVADSDKLSDHCYVWETDSGYMYIPDINEEEEDEE